MENIILNALNISVLSPKRFSRRFSVIIKGKTQTFARLYRAILVPGTR